MRKRTIVFNPRSSGDYEISYKGPGFWPYKKPNSVTHDACALVQVQKVEDMTEEQKAQRMSPSITVTADKASEFYRKLMTASQFPGGSFDSNA